MRLQTVYLYFPPNSLKNLPVSLIGKSHLYILLLFIFCIFHFFAVENWRVKETERMRAIVDELTKVKEKHIFICARSVKFIEVFVSGVYNKKDCHMEGCLRMVF